MSAAFFCFLQQHSPLALVILVYYCVVLDFLRQRWWIASWGKRVLEIIYRTLSSDWRSSIDWALRVTDFDCSH